MLWISAGSAHRQAFGVATEDKTLSSLAHFSGDCDLLVSFKIQWQNASVAVFHNLSLNQGGDLPSPKFLAYTKSKRRETTCMAGVKLDSIQGSCARWMLQRIRTTWVTAASASEVDLQARC